MTNVQTVQTNIRTSQRQLAVPTDEVLVARMAKGDQNALRLLFQRHYRRVHSFILRFTKDTEAAQEIANDTFLIAWRQAATFEGRSLVATWLLGIARYRALGSTKVRRFASESLDERHKVTLADPSDLAEVRIQREEADEYLRRCVAALPPKQGRLVELHYFHDVSLKDAAAMTGLPLNTVKTRLFLARKKIALMLAKEDDATSRHGVGGNAHNRLADALNPI